MTKRSTIAARTRERRRAWGGRALGCVVAVAAALASGLGQAASAQVGGTAKAPARAAAEKPSVAAHAIDAAATLRAKLAKSGRAEVSFVRESMDPLSGKPDLHRGSLALELPDRVLLEFSSTGERLALRGDGGEWLQPELEQMLRLRPEHLAAARLWWGFLLAPNDSTIRERSLGGRAFALVAGGSVGASDSATVTLDRDGLPRRLSFHDDSGLEVQYAFSGWRFVRPRGKSAFVLSAPKSFEVVELP